MSGRKEKLPSIVLILVFISLAAGIIVVGSLYYRNYKRNFRLEVERRLSAIAELKVSQLAFWRKKRVGDAAVFYKNSIFSALVRRHFEQPEDRETRKELRTWLGYLQAASQYERVMLLDPLYSERMIVPDGPEGSPAFVSPSSSEGLRAGKVVFEDFYWDEQRMRFFRERYQVTKALRESEGRHKALFVGAGEEILVADLKTIQFRYGNPAACRMFGYTEEELMRLGVAEIHPRESRDEPSARHSPVACNHGRVRRKWTPGQCPGPRPLSMDHVLAEFEALARGEKTLASYLPYLRKDGTLFYANVTAIPMVIDGHDCNAGFFTDITRQWSAEEDLRRAMEKLEQTNVQLEASIERADRLAFEAQAASAGGMALSALAAGEMEKAGKAGRPEEIAALMPELERQFDLLRAKMREGKP